MRFIVFICLICNIALAQKHYQRNYFDNGKLKSCGWLDSSKNKIGYWKTFYSNGKLKEGGHFKNNMRAKFWVFYNQEGKKTSEGHFKNNQKIDWWVFYDENGNINHKCQLKNNKKNGYCLMYKNKKLISAAKYSLGKKIKEWTDFKSFTKENSLSDLE
ncbi:toxin-antitoxin system YwqK family antitoxin [Neotamlana laminarinivorans]|uniref:MORN repeat protein n=1 Tax=Neotamlana laminarinivorans TaxID=2883124 RepID=A0A9X1HZQ6_9FLAO|nr:hypothetical protein [Tamlana laminarinivorans]MCB4799144.1 hypothetical protein [Tamlana laminarinivorans]